ncbi:MAG TPA: hypothetical protein VI357_06085, partial [Mycobacteriales bacterium]
MQERLSDTLGSAPGAPESDDQAFEQVRERVQALISAARTLSDTCADLADALRPAVPGHPGDDPLVAGFGRLRAERTAALLDEAASAARGTLGLLHSAYGALDRGPRLGPPVPRSGATTWPDAFVEVPPRAFTVDDEAGTALERRPGGRVAADATDPHGIPAVGLDSAPDQPAAEAIPLGTPRDEPAAESVALGTALDGPAAESAALGTAPDGPATESVALGAPPHESATESDALGASPDGPATQAASLRPAPDEPVVESALLGTTPYRPAVKSDATADEPAVDAAEQDLASEDFEGLRGWASGPESAAEPEPEVTALEPESAEPLVGDAVEAELGLGTHPEPETADLDPTAEHEPVQELETAQDPET